MPKIAASLVYPVSSPPVRNAVVDLDRNGVIISVGHDSAEFRETAGVEFYSGIMIPGLVDVFCGDRESKWLYARGVRVAGKTGMTHDGTGTGDKAYPFRGAGNDKDVISEDPCRSERTICPDSRKGGEVVYRIFKDKKQFAECFRVVESKGIYHTLRGKEGLPVLATCGRMEMIDLMLELQEGRGRVSLPAMLSMATVNGALVLDYDSIAGSIVPGMQPGLNIIEGADILNMRLLPVSRLRRLC